LSRRVLVISEGYAPAGAEFSPSQPPYRLEF
jgi:hypothetical protein